MYLKHIAKGLINLARYKDIIGQKFGKLTVIEYVGNDKQGMALWLCKCECGNETTVRGTNLRNSSVQSCGCLNQELSRERGKKKTGKNNPSYNPNISDEERADRRLDGKYKQWCKEVKKDANYTCDCCHRKGRKVTRSSFE